MANIRSLSVDLAQITTNSVDDRQKPMPYSRWQRRPSLDHMLKIRWNGYRLVQAIRRILRRLF